MNPTAPEPVSTPPDRTDAIHGALLGTAVGDALGLPLEGLAPRRAARLTRGPLRHRFLFGRGMVSDDTEHTCMLAQALLSSGGDRLRFTRSLAWRLRIWLLGLPAGIGLGTARAIVKLWLGFPASRSGVRSAGNGPAMRAALIGVVAPGGLDDLRRWVRAATELTHTDPRAERAAFLVALAARRGAECGPGGVGPAFLDDALAATPDADDELRSVIDAVRRSLASDDPRARLVADLELENGVSGYAYRTVPVVLWAWLQDPGDFRATVARTIELGGDADTTGAIAGAIAGATLGASAIPADWLSGVHDAPRSVRWMERLGDRLSEWRGAPEAKGLRPLPLFWPLLLPRNLLFLVVVLFHGLRRLLPPY